MRENEIKAKDEIKLTQSVGYLYAEPYFIFFART